MLKQLTPCIFAMSGNKRFKGYFHDIKIIKSFIYSASETFAIEERKPACAQQSSTIQNKKALKQFKTFCFVVIFSLYG